MEIIVSGYAYPTIAEETLKLWLKDMTFLNLFSYGFTGEGGITDLADEHLIEMSRNAGVQPLMVLTPMDSQGMFSDVLAAQLLENRQAQTALIENLLSLIRRKGLAGIDFDFDKNNNVERGAVTELNKPLSKVKVYIIPTNEELVIARETLRLK